MFSQDFTPKTPPFFTKKPLFLQKNTPKFWHSKKHPEVLKVLGIFHPKTPQKTAKKHTLGANFASFFTPQKNTPEVLKVLGILPSQNTQILAKKTPKKWLVDQNHPLFGVKNTINPSKNGVFFEVSNSGFVGLRTLYIYRRGWACKTRPRALKLAFSKACQKTLGFRPVLGWEKRVKFWCEFWPVFWVRFSSNFNANFEHVFSSKICMLFDHAFVTVTLQSKRWMSFVTVPNSVFEHTYGWIANSTSSNA